MTFSYSGNPGTSPTDAVRFHLQDTTDQDHLFENEEIQYYLDLTSASPLRAAANLAEVAAAKFTREVSISSDGTSIGMEQLADKFRALAVQLRAQWADLEGAGTGPLVGGVGDFEDNFYGGRPKVFGKKMHDNRQAGGQDVADYAYSYWQDYEYGGWWEG